ncbi:MAG TPA: DUF222 domain-containing protein, partial [Tepidisphaeraceae bacterium]|nr:DUF222 domain-containing protein [Tepidisphaeraceae bacterium]
MFEHGGRFIAQACGIPSDVASVAAPASELSAAALVDRVQAWEAASRAVMAAQLVDLVEFDDRQRADDTTAGVGDRLVGRSVGTQVGLSLSISASAGAGRVVFARTVVEQLTALLRVAEAGLIGEWHLRTVAVATVGLSTQQKLVIAEQLAADILGRAGRGVRQLSPHELGQAAARRVISIDPAAATRRFEQARRSRAVSVLDKHDGTAALWVKGPAEQTQLMYDEVAADARARRADGDQRPLEAIMFEQIYDSILHHLPTPGPDPMPTPDPGTEPPDTDTHTEASPGADAAAAEPAGTADVATGAGAAAADAAGAPADPGSGGNGDTDADAAADAAVAAGAAGAAAGDGAGDEGVDAAAGGSGPAAVGRRSPVEP